MKPTAFELTEALMNNILFSMEDQNGDFYVDAMEGIVVEGLDIIEDSGRFVSLPEWDSSEGFRLMEQFTASLKNQVIREKLTAALDRGKGVFRAFKDTLAPYPEAEQLWYSFKEQQMKKEVLRWYNALRESWGLERIGSEPEDTADLVLEDFRFRELGREDAPAAALIHTRCREEEPFFEDGWVFPGDMALAAETASGDLVGCICAVRKGNALYISSLEVLPEYRGLGIGEALFSRFLENLDRKGLARIYFDLPARVEGFSKVLFRETFQPSSTRYCLELDGA